MIDVTLEPKVVEKGAVAAGERLVARCYRVKSRKSLGGMIGLGGQRPIPSVGTEVRAHLQRRDGRWWVVYPNGFAPVEGEPGLADAPAIAAGRGRPFTYGLPVELWILFSVAGLATFGAVRLVKYGLAWRRARSQFSRAAGRHGRHIDGLRFASQEQATAELAEHGDMQVIDRLDNPAGHYCLAVRRRMVHADEDVIEPRQSAEPVGDDGSDKLLGRGQSGLLDIETQRHPHLHQARARV